VLLKTKYKGIRVTGDPQVPNSTTISFRVFFAAELLSAGAKFSPIKKEIGHESTSGAWRFEE
jgi:hypothetical protein